jgi:cytochrome c553
MACILAIAAFCGAQSAARGQAPATLGEGAKLYETRCAGCHDAPKDRTPPKSAISAMTPAAIVVTLADGVMKSQAAGLADADRRAIAAYLTESRIADGAVVWDFDTAAQAYDAVNGRQARGGAIDAGGATIANGILFVNSGYGRILGKPGNALFAFSVDGQ